MACSSVPIYHGDTERWRIAKSLFEDKEQSGTHGQSFHFLRSNPTYVFSVSGVYVVKKISG